MLSDGTVLDCLLAYYVLGELGEAVAYERNLC